MASTGGRHTLKRMSVKLSSTPAEDSMDDYSGSKATQRSGRMSQSRDHSSSRSTKSTRSPSSATSSVSSSSSCGALSITSDTSFTGSSSSKKPTRDNQLESTPQRPLRSKFSTTAVPLDDLSKDPLVREQVLLKLIKHVPHLLQTFCILDLTAFHSPILATSSDLLPLLSDSIIPGKLQPFHGEYLEKPWQITAEKYGDGRLKTRLTVSGDLYDPSPSAKPSPSKQRFYGHLELSDLVNAVRRTQGDIWTTENPPPDLWLDLAFEQLEKQGIPFRRLPNGGESYKVSRKDQLDLAMDIVRYLHTDYFTLEASEDVADVFDIKLVSPSLLDAGMEGSPEAPDLSSLKAHLGKGEPFFCNFGWGGWRTVYCVSMVGEEFDGWLCFLVDGALPYIW